MVQSCSPKPVRYVDLRPACLKLNSCHTAGLQRRQSAEKLPCSRIIILWQRCTDSSQIVCLQAFPAELHSLQSLFGPREAALRTGIVLQNKRYEVIFLVSAPGRSACCIGRSSPCIKTMLIIYVHCLQVHRHHIEGPDPLVYGRTMTNEPELTEGAAVHMLPGSQAGAPIFSVVTYEYAPTCGSAYLSRVLH